MREKLREQNTLAMPPKRSQKEFALNAAPHLDLVFASVVDLHRLDMFLNGAASSSGVDGHRCVQDARFSVNGRREDLAIAQSKRFGHVKIGRDVGALIKVAARWWNVAVN